MQTQQTRMFETERKAAAYGEALPDLNLSQCSLDELKAIVSVCNRCRLSTTRTQIVFSDGNPKARIMIIGEGPGQQEDETGVPFVGKAGQLLTKIIESVNFDRQKDVYICNIVKCRPPNNRAPEADEMASCTPYLQAQIQLIQPDIILLAGATAVKGLLPNQPGITKIRGKWFALPEDRYPWKPRVMPIFHPSYLLRNQSTVENSPKWHTWQDIQAVRKAYDAL
ncbi:MAG: uracil-DNA glycosylase [Vampirovibrionales bacterium]|nr:uracil-DNA glycosylase [Vampirovibrionales bacterium]